METFMAAKELAEILYHDLPITNRELDPYIKSILKSYLYILPTDLKEDIEQEIFYAIK